MIYPWLQTTWQHVLKRHQANTLPHAWLIAGKEGLGKNDFAKAIAKLLLCEAPKNEACNTCQGCSWFEKDSHPDFFHVVPEEQGKAIKVDQIRMLIAKLSQTPSNGFRQVVMLSPSDAMNIAAANALLKTLEEPNGNVVLILVTDRPQALPPTIYSRCQPLVLPTPLKEVSLSWLSKEYPDEVQLELLLDYVEGAPLAVKTLLENDFMALRTLLLNGLLTRSFNVLAFSEQCDKAQMTFILRILWMCVMDLLRVKTGVDARYLVAQDKKHALIDYAQLCSVRDLMHMQKKIARALSLWQGHASINPQMLLDDLFITWSQRC